MSKIEARQTFPTSQFVSRYKLAITLPLLFIISIALVCFLPFTEPSLFPETSAWSGTGFQTNTVERATNVAPGISAKQLRALRFWGSWCGNDANTGEIQSPPFRAPKILEMYVSGYPGNAGVGLSIQREGTRERIPLAVGVDSRPGEQWARFHWWLPASVQGTQVRVVATDQSTSPGGWLGVSLPRQLSFLGLFHQQLPATLLVLLDYLFNFGLFLLPGFALAIFAPIQRLLKSPMNSMILMVSTGATLGYLSFWIFFVSKPAGRIFTILACAASVYLLWLTLRGRNGLIGETIRSVRAPLTYAALSGCFYLCLFFLFTDPLHSGARLADGRFFHELRPGDNLIPQIFADKLFLHQPLRPFCCGDWLSSDRPPLQSGIVLFERPLHLVHDADLDYEILAVGLQSVWICAVWCLLTSLGTLTGRIHQTLGLLIFSGFLFYNSVYTWPKLLAATFVLFILSIFFDSIRLKRPFTYTNFALAACCLGLALVSHPGSMFSLAIFFVLLLRFRNLFNIRGAVLAAVIVAFFVLPWSAYQKFVDPPGNRLFKMHLAGVIPIDPRSAWSAISDAYHSHPLQEIAQNKISNLKLLAGRKPLDTFGVTAVFNDESREQSRIAQREWIWNAVGVLNFGWVAWLIVILRRKRMTPAIPCCGWLVAASLANLVFWSLVTFGPNETVTTHSSYADILLLSAGLIGFTLMLPSIVRFALLGMQIFNLWVVWVWSYPPLTTHQVGIGALILQWPMLLSAGMLMVILFWISNLRRDAEN